MLIDSHCHLDFPKLVEDQAGVVARALRAGVGRMVDVCTRQREFDIVCATAERYTSVFCTIGIHPHVAGEEAEKVKVEDIVKAASHPKVVGIGETGLDYFYNSSPREAQEESFRRHIRAAQEAKLPVSIHSRDAEEDTLRILKDEGKVSGVLHCFSSRRHLAEEGLTLGLYISFSGILTFKKSQDLRDIARAIPMDRILVETDAPYLAPEPYRGKTCEPAYVVKTAEVLAEAKGVNFDEIAKATTDNFFKLFTKCPPEASK
jgi:TatD DNase family protein